MSRLKIRYFCKECGEEKEVKDPDNNLCLVLDPEFSEPVLITIWSTCGRCLEGIRLQNRKDIREKWQR